MSFQSVVTTAKTFKKFADGIKFAQNLPSGCSCIDVVCDGYFDNSLKSREACGFVHFFYSQK